MESENSRESQGLPEEIRWRVHPFTENPWHSALLMVIIVLVCVGVWSWTLWGGMVTIALVLLVVSVAPYLFPTSYHLTQDGIEIRFLRAVTFRGWEELKNFYPHDVGVHLSTFRRPSGLDAFRGNYIRFGRGNREEVLRFLDDRIKREHPRRDEAES